MENKLEIITKNNEIIDLTTDVVIYEKKSYKGLISLYVEAQFEQDDEKEDKIFETEYSDIKLIKLNDKKLLNEKYIANNISIFTISNKGLITNKTDETGTVEFLNILIEARKEEKKKTEVVNNA